MKIKIIIGKLAVEAELNDTPTARKIADVLPIRAPFHTWGDEIYCSVPVQTALDGSAREEVELGDLGYWPTGRKFCIFFGPTPISSDGRIVPASAVNVIGKVEGDIARFKEAVHESEIIIELIQ